MKNIGIAYLATSVYTAYFDNFISTAQKIFPEDKKTVIVISDGLDEVNNDNINGMDIFVKHIEDLPYPLIPLFKMTYITKYIKEYNFDYILFFDADTILFDMPINLANKLKDIMDQNKLIISRHPHYLYNPNRWFDEYFIVKDHESSAYVDDDIINENKSYLITSFMGGKYEVLKKYADLMYKMIGKDLADIRKIPYFFDEAYFNKIYTDEILRDHQNTIYANNFITITPYNFDTEIEGRSNDNIWVNNFPEHEMIFMNQKYDVDIKNSKKNNE